MSASFVACCKLCCYNTLCFWAAWRTINLTNDIIHSWHAIFFSDNRFYPFILRHCLLNSNKSFLTLHDKQKICQRWSDLLIYCNFVFFQFFNLLTNHPALRGNFLGIFSQGLYTFDGSTQRASNKNFWVHSTNNVSGTKIKHRM